MLLATKETNFKTTSRHHYELHQTNKILLKKKNAQRSEYPARAALWATAQAPEDGAARPSAQCPGSPPAGHPGVPREAPELRAKRPRTAA